MCKTRIRFVTVLLFLFLCSIRSTFAQQLDTSRFAIKTNAILWGTASPNLGMEAAIGNQWTLDLSGSINPFTFADNTKWKHWQVTVEPRYWFGERFRGHFVGAHMGGGEFNVGNVNLPFANFSKEHRHEGWNVRGGLSYGYALPLSSRWGLEAEVGLGMVYAHYKQFKCVVCGDFEKEESKVVFAPTRLGLSLVYTIGKKGKKEQQEPETIILRDTVVNYVDRPVPVPVEVAKPEEQKSEIQVLEEKYPFLVSENDTISVRRGISVRYRLDSSFLDTDYMDNWEELSTLLQCIADLKQTSSASLTHVTIVGYASPEGDKAHNEKLGADRAEALRQYVAREADVCDCIITATSGGEDWEGLRELVVNSDMRSKKEVLDIIDNAPEADRKRRLQQLDGGRPWQSIKDVLFPQLRNACYISVWYKEIIINNNL